MLISKNVLTLFFLFVFSICLSQNISGIVLDSDSDQPLEGTTIYFDNTTYGTITNSKGEFVLKFHKDIKTPLIISFLGYEKVILKKFSTTDKLKIYLKESTSVLNEVILASDDGLSREIKLKEFRKHFLGESTNGVSCDILNEDDIILRYNNKSKLLTVNSNAPILIANYNLKYLITAELSHFEVKYNHISKNKKRLNMQYVYYMGNNFYRSLEEEPTEITRNKRKDVYLGSTLHFMRALASEKLKKEKYQLYFGDDPVNSRKYISVNPIDGTNNVKIILKHKLNIVFDHEKRSSFECLTGEFYIDKFGNHFPPGKVRFDGDLGQQRMGDALPLDFMLTNKFVNKN